MLLLLLVGLLAPLSQNYAVSAFRFHFQVAKQCATVGPTGGRRVLMTTYLADDATSNKGGSIKSSKKAAECLTPMQKEEAIAELRKIKERLRKAEHKLNSTLLEISEDNGSQSAVPKRPPATDAISTSIERHAPITSSYLENLSSKPSVKDESDTLFPVTADVVAPSVVAQVPLPLVQTTTIHELTPPTTTTTSIERHAPITSSYLENLSSKPSVKDESDTLFPVTADVEAQVPLPVVQTKTIHELTPPTTTETEPPPTTSSNEELVHDDIPSVEDLEDEVEFVKAQIKKLREEMAAERANLLKSLANMKQQKRPKDLWQHKRLEDVE